MKWGQSPDNQPGGTSSKKVRPLCDMRDYSFSYGDEWDPTLELNNQKSSQAKDKAGRGSRGRTGRSKKE